MTLTATQPTSSLRSDRIDLILNQLDQLPTLPVVATRVLEVTTSQESCARDVIDLIHNDQSLTTKILAMVSKASLGAPRTVSTLEKAVVLLGFEAIRHSVLSIKVFETFSSLGGSTEGHFDRTEFWKHSLAVASASHLIAERWPGHVDPEIAFVCGLLHDIGKVALDACLPKSYDRAIMISNSRHRCVLEVERELLGVDHTIAGKRLAQRWNFPSSMMECIWLHHHTPDVLPDTVSNPDLVQIVALADVWVREQRLGYSGYLDETITSEALAAQMGMPARLLGEIAPVLLPRIEERAELIGLEDMTSGDMFAQAVTRGNSELSRMSTALAAANKKLEARSQYLELIHRFNSALTGRDSLTDICRIGASCARELLSLGSVVVYTRDPQTDIFHAALCSGEELSAQVFAGEVADDESQASHVLTRHPRLIVAPGVSHAVRQRFGESLGPAPHWMLPIIHGQVLWGGILFHTASAEVERVNQQVNELLMFATALGNALVNGHERVQADRLNESLADVNRQLKTAQRELLRARSLAMIAEMAAGAAHELNNPLAVIAGRAEMLLEKGTGDSDKDVHIIIEQVKRCSAIVDDLMRFAKPPSPERRPFDLSAVLKRIVLRHLEKSSLSPAQVKLDISDEVAQVLGDPKQIEELFEALIENAILAVDPRKALLHINCDPDIADDMVVTTVADNGCGMSSKVLEKAADPFFSHRAAGRGRGLGLSRAQRWCEINGGRLKLDSRPGEGTKVWVELPKVPENA